jgi:hypothetical protein
MKAKKEKKVYPILAVRVKTHELDYIRREADERRLTVGQYVKAILLAGAPISVPDGK